MEHHLGRLLLWGGLGGEGLEASRGAGLGGLTAVRDGEGGECPSRCARRRKGGRQKGKDLPTSLFFHLLEFFFGNDLQGKALGFLR